MYSEILINKVFKGYEVTDGDAMQNLSRINILIGKNNSGKSRFMRRIFSSSNIKSISQGIRTNSLKELFEKIKSGATAAVNDLKGKGWQLVPGLEKASQLEIDALWIDPGQFVTAFESLNQLQGLYDFRRGVSNEVDVTEHFLLQELQELHEIFEADKSAMASLQRIYIPVLRGLRPLQITGQSSFESTVDNYQKRTRVDYFKEEEWLKEDSIVTGLHLYEEIKSLVRGKVSNGKRKKVSKNSSATPFLMV